MNAKLQRTVLFIAAVMLTWPAIAHSFEFPYLLKDPMRTAPEVMQKGVTLPGDSTPIPLSVHKDFTKPLSLNEAVDLALSNNQTVKSAWADIKVQAGALGEAYAPYLPTIQGIVNYTQDRIDYSDSRYISSDRGRFNVQASLNWRIFDFGGRTANRYSAQNLLAAALASYDATLQDALSKVVQAYFDATTAASSLKAKVLDEEIARTTLHSAQEREARGTVSQLDTLRAKTALAKASLDRSRAQGDYQKSLAVLRRHLGLPSGRDLTLPPELDDQFGADVESKELALWLENAQKNHPAIVAAKKQVDSAQEQVNAAKSAGLPTLNMAANYYQNTSPGQAVTASSAQETTVILGITIPFFDGFSSTYKIRGAQAKVEKQKAALADTELQVAMSIIRSYADTTSALQNLEASAALLSSAQSALASSQRKYDKGAADITELLSTQTALADAWSERVRCLAEWRSSRLQLLANAGRMGRFAVVK